ncbi:MAG TPA: hypothetical protein VK041_00505 [Opitutales bacterium]|nr:hypothetical protein [Opitutales bacterium]
MERSGYSLRIARIAYGPEGGVIEAVGESDVKTAEEAKSFVLDFAKEKPGNLVRAYCAVYPPGRILRNFDFKDGPKNIDLPEMLQQVSEKFDIDRSAYHLAILNADNGSAFEAGKLQKNFFVCGAPYKELQEAQDFLVKSGIYPLRLEIGSIGTIGLLLNQLQLADATNPVLFLEMEGEGTHFLVVSRRRIEMARMLPLGLDSVVAGVRTELGLKDEAAARRIFYSDSFDFREMGPRLVEALAKELQAMVGFYELQTGQSITQMFCGLLPGKLDWLNDTLAQTLGIRRLELDLLLLLKASNLLLQEAELPLSPQQRGGLFGLMFNREVEV